MLWAYLFAGAIGAWALVGLFALGVWLSEDHPDLFFGTIFAIVITVIGAVSGFAVYSKYHKIEPMKPAACCADAPKPPAENPHQ